MDAKSLAVQPWGAMELIRHSANRELALTIYKIAKESASNEIDTSLIRGDLTDFMATIDGIEIYFPPYKKQKNRRKRTSLPRRT